ncbi:MAG: hypothetical protein IPM80_04715 [Proteobacteria bacterium]|nr:hypothetical protein [Pseudomonadota bacterium]
MSSRSPLIALALLLLAAAGAMYWLAVLTVDDVFIVYRYARNLANGAGLVFNVGERVEGVTCFLWTLALAPLHALGGSLPRLAPLLCALCGLTTIALVTRLHAACEDRRHIAWRDLLPALLLVSSPPFIYWSVGALEAVPFALLVSLALLAHAREMRAPAAWPASALWLGLAAMTRPETPVVALALMVDRLLHARERGDRALAGKAMLRWLAVLAAVVLPFLCFRYAYFGEWLPNTYYAKLGAPLTARLPTGLHYLLGWTETLLPHFGLDARTRRTLAWQVLILLMLMLLVALAERRVRACALTAIALLVACVFEGGDWMTMSRFVVPALPALAVVGAAALLKLGARRHRAWLAAAVTMLVVVAGGVAAQRERDGGRGMRAVALGHERAHGALGRYIVRHAAPGDTVALMDVGLIGWLAADQRILDISGLTDHFIARAPGPFLDKRYPASYVLDAKPRFVVLAPGFGPDRRIAAEPGFQSRYRLVQRHNAQANLEPPGNYPLLLFERRADGGAAPAAR